MRKKEEPDRPLIDINSKEVTDLIDKNIDLLSKDRPPAVEREMIRYIGRACFADGVIMANEKMIERFGEICRRLTEETKLARRLENFLMKLVRTEGKA